MIKVSHIEGRTGGEEIWTPLIEQLKNLMSQHQQTEGVADFLQRHVLCFDRSGFHTAS